MASKKTNESNFIPLEMHYDYRGIRIKFAKQLIFFGGDLQEKAMLD